MSNHEIPQHPGMTRNGFAHMHCDAYLSDSNRLGPSADMRELMRSPSLGSPCYTVTFDRQGHLFALAVATQTLHALAPDDLRILDSHSFKTPHLGLSTAGGIYFYLDQRDRAVIATVDGAIARLALVEGRLVAESKLSLAHVLAADDKIVTVFPDWGGADWFISKGGTIGVLDPSAHSVRTVQLEGEQFFNVMACDRDNGVFMVSDRAIYCYHRNPAGEPELRWREEYPRSAQANPIKGHGSGTSPKLLGERWLAIADRQDPMHVRIYDRRAGHRGPRLTSSIPVFEKDRSMTLTSFVGLGDALIVANQHGMHTQGARAAAPGMIRIDIDDDGVGRVVWSNPDLRIGAGAMKLATGTGLLYNFSGWDPAHPDAWFVECIDFATGHRVGRIPVGTGRASFSFWAPIHLGPDGRLYAGVGTQLVAFGDA